MVRLAAIRQRVLSRLNLGILILDPIPARRLYCRAKFVHKTQLRRG